MLAGLVFVANLAAAYVTLAPLEFRMPGYGLDPSWMAVLGEASAYGWRFGRDIIFTSGPLSVIYTHWFRPDQLGLYVAANAVLIVTFAMLVTVLAWRSGTLRAAFLVALGITLCPPFPIGDAFLVVYPLLVALVVLLPEHGSLEKTTAGLGLICCALATLAKFLVAPAAVVTFILCDGALATRRRWPIYTVSYLLLCFGLFALIEGPASFTQYVSDTLNLASGYSEAMAIDRPPLELVIFLIAAGVLLGAFGVVETRAVLQSQASMPTAAVRWLIAAAYLFTMFKEGFVRHDLHSLHAWSALVIVAPAYLLAFRAAAIVPRAWCLVVATGSIAAIPVLYAPYWSHLQSFPAEIARQFELALDFARDPKKQIGVWREAKNAAWARVRSAQEIPHVDGSIDVIPSIQSSLMAYGLDYRPRYHPQEYQTFTKRLMEANRQALIERGPDFLLFQPGSIDGRFPALAEGPLWPDILATYAPVGEQGYLLLLRRRERPLENPLRAEHLRTIAFGDAVAIPGGPQFLKAKIKKTLFGKLVEVLYRPPILWMRVTLADGTELRSRMVSAMAQAGFLVSPLVITGQDFLLLYQGESARLPAITRISFETSRFGRYVYAPEIDISFSALSLVQDKTGQ